MATWSLPALELCTLMLPTSPYLVRDTVTMENGLSGDQSSLPESVGERCKVGMGWSRHRTVPRETPRDKKGRQRSALVRD